MSTIAKERGPRQTPRRGRVRREVITRREELQRVVEKFNQWLSLPDPGPLTIFLAALGANLIAARCRELPRGVACGETQENPATGSAGFRCE